jgi:bisanhydrobacterioruberin hydratase
LERTQIKNLIYLLWFYFTVGIFFIKFKIFPDLIYLTTNITMLILALGTIILASNSSFKYLLWCGFTILFTLTVEIIGINYGVPFGNYSYTNKLQPQIFKVPIVIGLSWTALIILSCGIAQKISKIVIVQSVIVGSLVTLLDILLEPAANKLSLWTFNPYPPPLINYFSWFILSVFLVLIGLRFKVIGNFNFLLTINLFLVQCFFFLFIAI